MLGAVLSRTDIGRCHRAISLSSPASLAHANTLCGIASTMATARSAPVITTARIPLLVRTVLHEGRNVRVRSCKIAGSVNVHDTLLITGAGKLANLFSFCVDSCTLTRVLGKRHRGNVVAD